MVQRALILGRSIFALTLCVGPISLPHAQTAAKANGRFRLRYRSPSVMAAHGGGCPDGRMDISQAVGVEVTAERWSRIFPNFRSPA